MTETNLAGRTALVTGAGTRVGRAIAAGLARVGVRVAIHYHSSRSGADELRREIVDAGGDARIFQADLSTESGAHKLVEDVASDFGELAALVNSAAIMQRTELDSVTVEDWDRIIAINLRAPFFLCAAAAPHLRRRKHASIVNIADVAAFETWPAYPVHGISKAGVVTMTRYLARILAPEVRVNAVAPGAVLLPDGWPADETRKIEATTPLRSLGSPDDVVGAVTYLLSAEYVTGEVLVVDGGRLIRR